MEEALRLKALLDNHECDVAVEERDDNLHITVDGHTYKVAVHKVGENSFLLINDLRVYDCRVEGKSRDRFEVKLNKHVFGISIVDPRRLRIDENSDRHTDGPTEIAAQMPGKVVRVLVEPGAEVEKDAGIIVVEAMKMQNEMKTPRAGIVLAVNVIPGDTVNAGDVLATVGETAK
jgi:biotin carboxyl carrier protein